MKNTSIAIAAYLFASISVSNAAALQKPGLEVPNVGKRPAWVIAIHGGAGTRRAANYPPGVLTQYRKALGQSLKAGATLLDKGADGPEAIEAALMVLENSPLFNAGRGGALDSDGAVAHDASIMRGDTLDAGAIAGSRRIRNPIAAARRLMNTSETVMLASQGADWFAAREGLDMVAPIHFITERRRELLLKKRDEEAGQFLKKPETHGSLRFQDERQFGTVGAVVLDKKGTISAGTSTGGRTGKAPGRIGDSPIIGAGTYASNTSCAVSGTGKGEHFIRWTTAKSICARVELAGEALEVAASKLIHDIMAPTGGSGAVIAIDPSGKVVFAINTRGTYRGVMSSKSKAKVAVFADQAVE